MVFIDGKEVVFATNFLIEKTKQAVVVARHGQDTRTFVFNFVEQPGMANFAGEADQNGRFNATITYDPRGVSQATPVLLGRSSTGSELSCQYSLAALGPALLMHFYILSQPAVTSPA